MNLAHTGNLDKLARSADLQKDIRYRAGLALEALSTAVVEATPDDAAGVKEMLRAFTLAMAAYEDGIKDGVPEEAARRFAEETKRIVRERALAQAVKASLQKGMTAREFWNR